MSKGNYIKVRHTFSGRFDDYAINIDGEDKFYMMENELIALKEAIVKALTKKPKKASKKEKK